MKNKLFIIVSMLALFCLTGCDQSSGMLGGGALGTAFGAAAGYAIGGSGGAVLGGVIGGLGGAAVGADAGAKEQCQDTCSTTRTFTERVYVQPVVTEHVYVENYGGVIHEYREYRNSRY